MKIQHFKQQILQILYEESNLLHTRLHSAKLLKTKPKSSYKNLNRTFFHKFYNKLQFSSYSTSIANVEWMLYTHVVYYFITLAYCTASAPNMVSENKYKRNEQWEKLNTETELWKKTQHVLQIFAPSLFLTLLCLILWCLLLRFWPYTYTWY